MNKRDSIKNIIDSRLSNLKLNDEFESKVLSKANKPKTIKKPLAIAVAVCLFIMLTIPVMATAIPSFTALVSLLSSEVALMLQPIESVSEDNGIKMEVVAAMNDDETAVAYVTMQDLTGDRVDQTISLDIFSITGASMFTNEVIAYDEKTKTATIRLLANGGRKLNGKKVALRVNSFLSGQHKYNEVETGVDLTGIHKNVETIPLDMNNIPGGGGMLFETLKSKSTIQILKTDKMDITLPGIDFVHISNIGFVDGLLHVQLKWSETSINDHGYVYLTDASGNIIYPSNVSFGTDESGNTKFGNQYEEDIFDINSGQLGEFKLKGYFVTYSGYIQGNWETTFRIEAVAKSKQADCNIDLGNLKINSVSISPLGVSILGDNKGNRPDDIDISVIMADGSVQEFNSTTTYTDRGNFTRKYMPNSPLAIENVKEVIINGVIVKFN